MAKIRHTIAGIPFASKGDVLDHVRQNIISQYDDYQPLYDGHFQFMLDLLRQSYFADRKFGCGVRSMWIQPNEPYLSRGFWLERIDGTQTDFSFRKCLAKPRSQLALFKHACRQAIIPVVIAFRDCWFSEQADPTCALSGTPLSRCNSHVDHAAPQTFDVILMDYIESRQIDVECPPILSEEDGQIGCELSNKEVENDWVAFHNERATLRVISIEAHKKLSISASAR